MLRSSALETSDGVSSSTTHTIQPVPSNTVNAGDIVIGETVLKKNVKLLRIQLTVNPATVPGGGKNSTNDIKVESPHMELGASAFSTPEGMRSSIGNYHAGVPLNTNRNDIKIESPTMELGASAFSKPTNVWCPILGRKMIVANSQHGRSGAKQKREPDSTQPDRAPKRPAPAKKHHMIDKRPSNGPTVYEAIRRIAALPVQPNVVVPVPGGRNSGNTGVQTGANTGVQTVANTVVPTFVNNGLHNGAPNVITAQNGATNCFNIGINTGAQTGANTGAPNCYNNGVKNGVPNGVHNGANTGVPNCFNSSVNTGAPSGAQNGANTQQRNQPVLLNGSTPVGVFLSQITPDYIFQVLRHNQVLMNENETLKQALRESFSLRPFSLTNGNPLMFHPVLYVVPFNQNPLPSIPQEVVPVLALPQAAPLPLPNFFFPQPGAMQNPIPGSPDSQ